MAEEFGLDSQQGKKVISSSSRLRRARGDISGVTLLFLYPRLQMRWVENATPRPLYPRERPGTHCIGGWVGPRVDLDGCGKSSTGIRSPDRPARSQSLYRLSYRGQPLLMYVYVTSALTCKKPIAPGVLTPLPLLRQEQLSGHSVFARSYVADKSRLGYREGQKKFVFSETPRRATEVHSA